MVPGGWRSPRSVRRRARAFPRRVDNFYRKNRETR
jgi:hypothetical protein